jgi:acyl-coenzyme A synthetase/AMP-(fatty) acid ligase
VCVPLDPSWPEERIAAILTGSGAELVVTHGPYLARTRELMGDAQRFLDADAIGPNVSAGNPTLTLAPGAPTCINYTSGSTGAPKGVTQTHRSLLDTVRRITNSARISARDRQTLLRSCSYGGASWDIFGSLLNGAALYPIDLHAEGLGAMAPWMIRHEITLYRSPVTLFRHFVATLTGDEAFPHLRWIHVGGEPVHRRDVELHRKHFDPRSIFINALGITETGLVCDLVPVGFPVEDMEVLLLDDAAREIRDGQVGEIAVRSRFLSPGYWRRPDLTAAAFLPDPFSEGSFEPSASRLENNRRVSQDSRLTAQLSMLKAPPVRLYLTGDLGRREPDGCLLHLGRKDFQVKALGLRIEVAEIEMALLERGDIQEAVVVSREDQPGDARLVAYAVPAARPGPTVSALRRGLAERLPPAMLPSVFVLLEALPLTAAGKVDRKALPPPGWERPELETAYAAPRTPVERTLAGIWAEVLSLGQVGLHDDFLELGGHSLLAARVLSRVGEVFQVELTGRALFDAPTVASLALVIVQQRAEQTPQADLARLLAEVEQLGEGCPLEALRLHSGAPADGDATAGDGVDKAADRDVA